MRKGDPFGTHRVLQPAGALPQAAWKLDNGVGGGRWDNEVLIDVRTLNVDAASFRQLEQQAAAELSGDGAGGGPPPAAEALASRVGELILRIVAERGKLHNPVTGSGGMLIGPPSPATV